MQFLFGLLNNRRQYLSVSLLVFLCAGCTPEYAKDIHVMTEIGSNAKLSDYRSYIWLENITKLEDPSGKWQPSGMDIAGQIKFFIDRELNNNKLYLNPIDPDLAVAFEVNINGEALKLEKDTKSHFAILKNVPEASLMVYLIDTETQAFVWIGKAEADLQATNDAQLVRKRIEYAITQMFKNLE